MHTEDRYPSKRDPHGHRPKSRREPDDELVEDLHAYSSRDSHFPSNATRASTRSGRDSYEPTHFSRAATRQSDYDQRTEVPARSRATTRVTDREQTDRRTANPPSTLYSTSKASGTDHDRSSRPAKNKAPTTASTRASTLHPDDSVSNGPYQPRDHHKSEREPEARGRYTASTTSRSQYDSYHDYPPTLSPVPSSRSSHHHSQSQRQHSPSITHAHSLNLLDPRPTYTYAGVRPSEAPTHRSEASRRSEAPTATTLRSSTSRRETEAPTYRPSRQSEASTHRSSRHSEAPTHYSSHQGPVSTRNPPPPPPSYRTEIRRPEPSSRDVVSGAGSGGGRFTAYEQSTSTWTGTEDEFEYMNSKMSGFSLRR